MKRRNFSPEFKHESAQLVVDQNYTVADAAKAMDVGLSTMTRWGWRTSGKNTKSLPDNSGTNRNTRAKEKSTTNWNGKRKIKKGYHALDVGVPEQFSIIGKLRMRYPVATLCHVFRVNRSSYKYWKNRSGKPDGRRAVLCSQILELHGISHGSAGARSIAKMATRRSYQMERWLAGRLYERVGLVSCQQTTHLYMRGGHVTILNGSSPWQSQIKCGDVTYIDTGKI